MNSPSNFLNFLSPAFATKNETSKPRDFEPRTPSADAQPNVAVTIGSYPNSFRNAPTSLSSNSSSLKNFPREVPLIITQLIWTGISSSKRES